MIIIPPAPAMDFTSMNTTIEGNEESISYVNVAAVLGKSAGAPSGGFLADIIG